MSEAKAEGKKKGKMPVIIAVVAVLFGGGFFMMKGKGGEKKEPEIKLGKIVEMDEKLVNLTDQATFLRTTIALHLKEGFDETKLKDVMPAVEDSVVTTLKSLGPNDVKSNKSLARLKRVLAQNANEVLSQVVVDPKHEKEGKDKEKKEGAKKEGDSKAKEGHEEPEHPDWDSDHGPILKVYFKAFAIQ
jgi:flagellar basal body-associated protein FliL